MQTADSSASFGGFLFKSHIRKSTIKLPLRTVTWSILCVLGKGGLKWSFARSGPINLRGQLYRKLGAARIPSGPSNEKGNLPSPENPSSL
jgi:hypothetical protein